MPYIANKITEVMNNLFIMFRCMILFAYNRLKTSFNFQLKKVELDYFKIKFKGDFIFHLAMSKINYHPIFTAISIKVVVVNCTPKICIAALFLDNCQRRIFLNIL